jgi:hypothetical protein
LALGRDEEWSIISPDAVTDPRELRLFEVQAGPDEPEALLAELKVGTEEGTHLRGILVESPPGGGHLFLRDDFIVALEFRRSGAPIEGLTGDVTVDVNRRQFEVVNGDASRSIVVGRPIKWSLRPQDPAKDAPISFTADVESLDRNGKPISLELPPPFRVNVDDSWNFRMYFGLGRLSFRNMGVELEPGFKYRLTNIMERGIPLNLVAAFGFGMDHASIEDISACDIGDEVLFMDYRYWASGGLSLGISRFEVCFDLGYMSLDQWIYPEIPDICMAEYKKTATHGLYVQPGLEFGFPHLGSIYAGLRIFSGLDEAALEQRDMDSTEFLIQFRLRNER